MTKSKALIDQRLVKLLKIIGENRLDSSEKAKVHISAIHREEQHRIQF